MKLKFYSFALAALCLFFSQNARAQAPFWSEDFTNGFPTGWGNDDPSGNKAYWTWCADPANDGVNGCPKIWNTPVNQQKPFAAPTASTGFVTLDSDHYGNLTKDHQSQMTTTALDCSGQTAVWLSFATHLGTYTYTADDHAIVRVSTDKVNWTEFKVFKGLTTSVRWSKNPHFPVVDLTAVAAGQSKVYIQWQWVGNWDYMWSVDDVALYNYNPTPANDLAIGQFFFPISNYATPQAHIGTDTSAFSLQISNFGLTAQSNVWAKVWVENETGFLLHKDSISVGTIPVGTLDSEFIFPKIFVPTLVEGRYFIRYQTGSGDHADQRPDDNATRAEFVVTQGQFAKEKKPEQGFRPSGWDDTWYVCNYYRLSAGNFENYVATSADMAFTTDPADIAIGDVEAVIYLMKIKDDILDDLSNLDDNDFFASLDWAGITNYEAPDTLQDNASIQRVQLEDFATSQPGVRLDHGGRYLLCMSYANASRKVYHLFNDDLSFYFNSTLIYTDAWGPFGPDANAVLRMNIALVTATDDKPLADKVLRLFPNPARDVVNLAFDFKYPTDATITIADLTGRVVSILDKTGLTNEVLPIALTGLASGNYLARVATQEGTKTVKFEVVK